MNIMPLEVTLTMYFSVSCHQFYQSGVHVNAQTGSNTSSTEYIVLSICELTNLPQIFLRSLSAERKIKPWWAGGAYVQIAV